MSRNELVSEVRTLLAEAGPVELTETSKSWLFIGPDKVFKLKKAIRDELQDLTHLRERHDNTLTEIDLNRRLAPDLYLGAVRLGRNADGCLAAGDPCLNTIDWLVEMRRLPAERMLDAQIAAGGPHAMLAKHVDALVPVLAAFYGSAPATRLKAPELLTVQEDQLEMARQVLLNPRFAGHHPRIRAILDGLNALRPKMTAMLARRVHAGGIVEGHGDLRPEHICFCDVPVIYDCLEFNRTLRLVDPFSEIAFLGLECAMLGADWIGPHLISALEASIGPGPEEQLLRFYQVCHAIVRARLSFAHMLVPMPRTPEKWIPLGLRYLEVAERLLP
ncbi:hypothetical protein [Jannaschia faecimaris]|nr:hypothetical protein [Jannaschia faecimaris]